MSINTKELFLKIKNAWIKAKEANFRTPLMKSRLLSSPALNSEVYLKLECFQITGSFKVRGAYNKILELPPERIKKGVITASAGNHGQGVAYAAKLLNIPAIIVVPELTPFVKIKSIKDHGANIIEKGKSYDEAAKYALELAKKKDMEYIHAFDDLDVIAGQGVIGLEILEDLPYVDVVICPIGGGGLISGIATAIKHKRPEVKIIGVQAAHAAAMRNSIKKGEIETLSKIETIADGLAVKTPGRLTFEIVKQFIDEIVVVDDQQIANAILKVIEVEHIVTEGAGVTPIAALLNNLIEITGKKKVACILSGGNIDVTMLDKIINKGLVFENRFISIQCDVLDKPGNLVKLLKIIADLNGNVVDIRHHRRSQSIKIGHSHVAIDLEIRDADHGNQILNELKEKGFLLEGIY
ncbi:MAG: threonine ammonia-lyase [Deltaproteobacteria bacterium]|nr:threonine ammonia-lyase [Deltaproteobacteria bacterium]